MGPEHARCTPRRIRPKEPPTGIDWDDRITQLLKEEPGDVIVTAVGDMIFNEKITHLADPERGASSASCRKPISRYGNLEFSLNDRPELQRPFYNFRAPGTSPGNWPARASTW